MKKVIFLLLIFIACELNAQTNLQLHYDFGRDRKFITSTVEHLSFDKYGSNFFFVDFNYKKNAPVEAYWEIARELKFWKAPFSVHVEYNGGLNTQVQINNAWLLGGTYGWNSKDFTKGFSFSAMYKFIQGNESPHNFQLTGVWYMHFFKGRVSFLGFADFWREVQSVSADHFVSDFRKASYIFIAEPQLWYNITKSLSVGTEVELAYNFAGVAGFNVCPTLGVKWIF